MTDRTRIHFVCTANICRSPYCEARARYLFEPDLFEFSSSGIQATTGRSMYPEMLNQLKARQPRIRVGYSAPTTVRSLRDADLILAMTIDQRDRIILEWPETITRTFTLPQFAAAATIMTAEDHSMPPAEVIRVAFANRGAAGIAPDIEDPYLKGEDAARRCADLLDHYLADIRQALTPDGTV